MVLCGYIREIQLDGLVPAWKWCSTFEEWNEEIKGVFGAMVQESEFLHTSIVAICPGESRKAADRALSSCAW